MAMEYDLVITDPIQQGSNSLSQVLQNRDSQGWNLVALDVLTKGAYTLAYLIWKQ